MSASGLEAAELRQGSRDSSGREAVDEPRPRDSPCRFQLYCAETLAEIVCGTLLIVLVYTEGSYAEDGTDVTEGTLMDLYLASAASALKYATLRLAPLAYSGGSSWPGEGLGSDTNWGRLSELRRRRRARAWCIPLATTECAFVCLAILLFSKVHGIAAVHLSAVFAVNVVLTLESFVAAAVGHRRGYREVFPEIEVIRPVKYSELVRSNRNAKQPCCRGCAICLQDFIPQDSVVRLPCGHVFHAECAGQWMGRGHGCPYRCRHAVAHLAWDPSKLIGR